jgi:hypothetical protein
MEEPVNGIGVLNVVLDNVNVVHGRSRAVQVYSRCQKRRQKVVLGHTQG